jgi:hypothetical protein
MNWMRLGYFILLLPLLSAAQPTPTGAQIKEQHKAAAQAYYNSMAAGVKLSGTISENGSPGTFEAYFLGDTWVVRQRFGELSSFSYDGPEGSWSGSNYGLPYKFETEDNPASATLNLLTGGDYLEEPYWSSFTFIDDVAGGYNFTFAPEGLPPATVVLYSDPATPYYLQIMSVELRLAPSDPDSHTYRSFYYYKQHPDGRVFTERETGRELDSQGETSSFSEYTVEKVETITELPTDVQPNLSRAPLAPTPPIPAPLDIPVQTGGGYFLVPVTFAGSDQTWNFIFDTGASASLFTPEAAAAAGLVASVNVPAHGHGSRVDFQMGMCTTASIGAADAPAEQRAPLAGFPAARVHESNTDVLNAFRSYGAAGILGVSLLHQYVVTFDHLGDKITLIPPQLFGGKQDVPTPNVEIWLDVEDLIYVTAYVTDKMRPEPLRGEVVLDTGLQQQLAVLRETMNSAGMNLEVVASRNNTVLGGSKKFDYVKVPQFDLAIMSWQNVEASMTDDDKGTLSGRGLLGFVGVPFFFGTRVTIDCFGERMYVRPLEQAEMQKLMEDLQKLGGPADDSENGASDDEVEPEGNHTQVPNTDPEE